MLKPSKRSSKECEAYQTFFMDAGQPVKKSSKECRGIQKMEMSNYEITKKKMADRFLLYDQEKMIRKYGLTYDEETLYLEFVGEMYEIDRETGVVRRCGQSAEEAGFNEAMSIYDVLCDAKDECSLSGVFCPTASLKGIVKGGSFLPGEGGPKDNEYFFDTHFKELKMACEQIGGVPEGKGDAAYRIWIFPFLPLRFQFWRADEDFEPEIQFLWDENVLSYLHFETLYYVMGHILQRLKELIQETK
jgi:hypothetical protein